jgi:hypothetical protein
MRLNFVSRFMLFINLLNFITTVIIIHPQKKLLTTIFGKTFESSARAKLRTIMTDTCANNFSVQGTSVKISIRNFEIINYIRGEQFLKHFLVLMWQRSQLEPNLMKKSLPSFILFQQLLQNSIMSALSTSIEWLTNGLCTRAIDCPKERRRLNNIHITLYFYYFIH